ncbi:hypothetical protein LINGRAHAP2_LOCUS23251, partial [Linum grandiflorum]
MVGRSKKLVFNNLKERVRGTEKGNYSVKSGYHMEMQRTEVVNDGGAGSTPEETACWKKIWKLNIP